MSVDVKQGEMQIAEKRRLQNAERQRRYRARQKERVNNGDYEGRLPLNLQITPHMLGYLSTLKTRFDVTSEDALYVAVVYIATQISSYGRDESPPFDEAMALFKATKASGETTGKTTDILVSYIFKQQRVLHDRLEEHRKHQHLFPSKR